MSTGRQAANFCSSLAIAVLLDTKKNTSGFKKFYTMIFSPNSALLGQEEKNLLIAVSS